MGLVPAYAVAFGDPPVTFNRVKAMVSGIYTEPTDDIDSLGYQAELAGHWSLSDWSVLTLGLGQQADRYRHVSDETLDVTARYGFMGGRFMLPSDQGVTASVAVQRYRGRLIDEDDERYRLAYDWGEVGVHLFPYYGPGEFSFTLRQYQWADDTTQWVGTTEWLVGADEWRLGAEGEVALDQTLMRAGLSVNYAF